MAIKWLLAPSDEEKAAREARMDANIQENRERAARLAEADRLPEKHKDAEGTRSSKQARDLECQRDWACWAEKHLLEATVACQPSIEERALIDFRWTDGWLEAKFDRFRQTTTPNSYTYIGNKIEFQLQNGAWIRHNYQCTYNIESKMVAEIIITVGR